MEFFLGLCGVLVAFSAALCLLLFSILTLYWWVFPNQKLKKLKKFGLGGPTPSFPLGNIGEMKRKNSIQSSVVSSNLSHDIHSNVFPYFSSWQKSHGNKSPITHIIEQNTTHLVSWKIYIYIYIYMHFFLSTIMFERLSNINPNGKILT